MGYGRAYKTGFERVSGDPLLFFLIGMKMIKSLGRFVYRGHHSFELRYKSLWRRGGEYNSSKMLQNTPLLTDDALANKLAKFYELEPY